MDNKDNYAANILTNFFANQCGNLVFKDFSTSELTEEENGKFKSCMENYEKVMPFTTQAFNLDGK